MEKLLFVDNLDNLMPSNIISHLIKLAGQCDHYGSDIVYDIEDIRDAIRLQKIGYERYLGFRNAGVDSTQAIKIKWENKSVYGFNYFSMVKFCIEPTRLALYDIDLKEEYLWQRKKS